MSYPITIRQDPAANWTAQNPTLLQYQFGLETDTGKAKLGDGVTAWTDLGYWSPSGVGGGDVSGPGSSASGNVATWEGTGGDTVADGGMALPASSGTLGYLNIPQNSKSIDYTLVAADAGKHIYQTGASKTVTIPANASVAFAIGTAVTFIATDAGGCSIAITSDTMTLADSTTTGTRTLAQNGVATAIKVTATSWVISGAGLT